MTKVKQAPDPWQRTTTENGFPADEVISALQKSIRRGLTENAVLLGWEMFITSPELEAKLWSRLQVIAVEDVGFGNPRRRSSSTPCSACMNASTARSTTASCLPPTPSARWR